MKLGGICVKSRHGGRTYSGPWPPLCSSPKNSQLGKVPTVLSAKSERASCGLAQEYASLIS